MKKTILLIIAVVALCMAPAFSQTSITGGAKIPSVSGQSGKYLSNNGTKYIWSPVTAGLSASLTPGYIPYAVSSTSLANSSIYQNGNNIGIGRFPNVSFEVKGSANGNYDACRFYSNNELQYLDLGFGGIESTYYLKLKSGSGQGLYLQPANGVVNITSCPTSSVGLSTGDIYSNAGVLMIIP